MQKIHFHATLQFACLPQRFLQDSPIKLVQMIRIDTIRKRELAAERRSCWNVGIAARSLFLIAQAQELDEVKGIDDRRRFFGLHVHPGCREANAFRRVRRGYAMFECKDARGIDEWSRSILLEVYGTFQFGVVWNEVAQ